MLWGGSGRLQPRESSRRCPATKRRFAIRVRKETDGGEAGTSTVRSSGITRMMPPDFELGRPHVSSCCYTGADTTRDGMAHVRADTGQSVDVIGCASLCKVPLDTLLLSHLKITPPSWNERGLFWAKLRFQFADRN
jgi:hypothetical protein